MKNKSNVIIFSVIGAIVLAFIAISFFKETPEIEKVDESEAYWEEIESWYDDVNNKKTVVTVIGSSTCPHCQEYKPIITSLAEEKNFIFYFFESDKLNNEQYNILTNTYELENYEGYVPYTFVIKDNKFVKDTTGFESKDATVKFLKETKVIKK